MVVVSGHDHDPPVADRLAERLEERPRDLQHLGDGPVPHLEDVAEQDHLVGALDGTGEQLRELGAAHEVRAGAGAEVEVGGENRLHVAA